MIKTPLLMPIMPFKTLENTGFYFSYSGNSQVLRNNLVIERLSDNFVMYDQIQSTFSFVHNLPANTLVDGVDYRAKIRVSDISTDWSEFSEYVIFTPLSDPIITIPTIDYINQNKVYSQTVTFEANYSHPNGEIMEYYKYFLYNSNQVLLQSFDTVFSDGTNPLVQEIGGLQNNETYYLKVEVKTQRHQYFSTGMIEFIPFYISPKVTGTVNVFNKPENGSIHLSAFIKQIVLELYDENDVQVLHSNVEYVDGTKLDLNRPDYKHLSTPTGFSVGKSNFVLRVKFSYVPAEVPLVVLQSSYGNAVVSFANGVFRCEKKSHASNIKAVYVANEIVFSDTDTITLYLKFIDGGVDIEVSV